MTNTINIEEYLVPRGLTVGSPSRILDTWSPTPLLMLSPAFKYANHSISFETARIDCKKCFIRHEKIKKYIFRKKYRAISDGNSSAIYFDCRHDTSANISHVLQNQIGVALHGLEAVGLEGSWRDLRFIVHENTPNYSINLFRAMGFEAIQTDGPVSGNFISMDPAKFPFRPFAGTKLREHAIGLGILDEQDKPGESIFIARRGRRSLSNHEKIEPILNNAGYKTVYPEDLSAEEQIKTVACAKDIFGLHGAALGYLMFRDPGIGGTLVEAFPSVFATNWARSIATTKNMQWVGCMGEFDHKAMFHMQNGAHAHKYEANKYSVDPHLLSLVLEAINQRGEVCKNICKICSIDITTT